LALWGNEEDLAVSIWESHGKTFRTRGRCYDHNFLRFLPIFSEKIGIFLKNQCYDNFFAKTSST
jgi:hypothetical protein